MSWMDSWSRPSKSQATPPPLYLTHGDSVPYCHTCGRVIGDRRASSAKRGTTEAKYCSDKCKHSKPSTAAGSLDQRIESAIKALLLGQDVSELSLENTSAAPAAPKPQPKPKKGDPRIIISINDIEAVVFGNVQDPEKVYGRKKNRAKRGIPDAQEWKSVDMEERPPLQNDNTTDANDIDLTDEFEGDTGGVSLSHTRVRPPQSQSEINFSVGGERGWSERLDETPEMLKKRREGQKRAEERELVKNAARRAVVFGVHIDVASQDVQRRPKKRREEIEQSETVQKKCEALMSGSVVEPSFAKGDWSLRWRED